MVFQLITLRDTIHIPPNHLHHPLRRAMHDAINIKYANHVIADHGLIITLHTLLTTQPPHLHPIDAGIHVHSTFSLITFNPLPSELFTATITKCDVSGILCRTNFFDWIVVTAKELPQPSFFDEVEHVWVWEYEGHRLHYDIEQTVRLKVMDVEYAGHAQIRIKRPNNKSTGRREPGDPSSLVSIADCRPTMKVLATMKEDGLGLISWWD